MEHFALCYQTKTLEINSFGQTNSRNDLTETFKIISDMYDSRK